jgi:hypothetical protein
MPIFVNYCSGDAPGSPAYLEYEKARDLLAKNSEYCALMERATGVKYQLPHIGGECRACRRLRAGLPKREADTSASQG